MIGVAISTHKRPVLLAQMLAEWNKYPPDVLIVNDDVNGDGVAVTKNRGIADLMDAGVEHLFLADDDVCPRRADWWKPYVEHAEPHLALCWGGRNKVVENTRTTTVWRLAKGVLLYAHRSVIERVGGMRTDFGRWGGEHNEWSRRIHNAGLTSHEYQDVIRSDLYFYPYDRWQRRAGHTATISDAEKWAEADYRAGLRRKYHGTDDFVEYR